MTPHQPRTRGRPPAADQAQVTAAALRLLEEVGLDGLTMRKLATAVGVQVGTLYSYFPTKRALVTAMAEAMLSDCRDAAEGITQPRERVWTLARSLRTALLSYRDGARVYAGTHAIGPNTLGFAEALNGTLREAGLGTAAAMRTALLILHFTTGHTLEEQAAIQSDPDLPAGIEQLRTAIRDGDYPHLAEGRDHLTGTDLTELFEQGLGLLTAELL
ncbi:TetR/AcrR family transcriptional regulator [Kibdelosporangium phytohabitans]|uniref:Transcriptional regulator n=1 Tax=Kibdelosporangium phytohabitans TaxID=860235 RepID=A0A0N9I7A1_9PSEU|nr:TetR/AcrR family transcriptional regulator [Kibdelosporangium phytohabitans]ALG10379.1 transcriptional regulator [Kibdelosporangium phytohabitans]MBE1461429.1 TetR/AcrR family tetracycline transcriptional repressor [Kibdelosporangium phytohabitans]